MDIGGVVGEAEEDGVVEVMGDMEDMADGMEEAEVEDIMAMVIAIQLFQKVLINSNQSIIFNLYFLLLLGARVVTSGPVTPGHSVVWSTRNVSPTGKVFYKFSIICLTKCGIYTL